MKKQIIMGLVLTGCVMFTACGNEDTPQESISGNGAMSVSEAIAAEVSENIIPEEALTYITLDYQIPEGFSPTDGSTDTQTIYVSDTLEDYSFISYTRQEADPTYNYTSLKQEDYSEALESRLGTTVTISSFTTSQEADYFHVSIQMGYAQDNQNYDVREEIFVTDKYVFTMVYAQGDAADWTSAFEESIAGLHLENVVNMEN